MDAVIVVHSQSIIILLSLIRREFAQLEQRLPKAIFMAFVVLTAGLCTLAAKPTARAIAGKLGGVSHDALTRCLTHAAWNAATLMLVLINHVITLMSATPCVSWLILDDVLIPKPYAKAIAGVYWDWDHVTERHLPCQRLVVVLWTNGTLLIPVAFSLWHKKNSAYLKEQKRGYRTKNELARCLIYRLKRRGLPFDYLTFDAWYAGKENLKFFHRLKVTYYAAIKNNCAFKFSGEMLSGRKLSAKFQTRDFCSYRNGDVRARSFDVRLSGVAHDQKMTVIKNYARSVFLSDLVPTDKNGQKKKVKDPNKYLITNDTAQSTYGVVLCYRSRWSIEVMFRDLKQHLGLCVCQHRSMEAVNRHFALCLFAYVCLQHLRRDLLKQAAGQSQPSLTIGDVKTHLQRQLMIAGPIPSSAGSAQNVFQMPMNRETLSKHLVNKTQAEIRSCDVCSAPPVDLT